MGKIDLAYQNFIHNSNLLLNVGPMADGTIDPLFEEILLEMGQWLQVNGEAIYDSIPWSHQNDTPAQDIWYTASEVSIKTLLFSHHLYNRTGKLFMPFHSGHLHQVKQKFN